MFLLVFALGIQSVWAAPEIVYVQAEKTALKAGPQMAAPTIGPLVRGEELEVLEKRGVWLRVRQTRSGGREGWVSKLFTSSHKPVGHATLSQEVKVSLEKASRRRESSYSVTASTRGLNADERVRGGRELFRADYDALKKMEAFKLQEGAVRQFRKSGNLE
ncbi:MAG: hypothetical protein A2X94_04045 [Bdellovibrionales bacterium GWB1_55_8]|nr:MAG: hypothetical protein A2X94_04045 [Bdellovibrionales bacterium GWB1_55_8]